MQDDEVKKKQNWKQKTQRTMNCKKKICAGNNVNEYNKFSFSLCPTQL